MTTQQMHYFITLAAHLNYTNAASELQMSVSTLSRQIILMENELNVQLFSRDNRNVKLTSCGKFFLDEVRHIYEKYQYAVSTTCHIYQGYTGSISIGVLYDITLNGVLQNYLELFRRKYPNMTLHLERGSYKQLIDGVTTGRYDCIICFFFALQNMVSLKYKIIEKITEGILISSKNPLAKNTYFEPEHFKNQTFILISQEDNNDLSKNSLNFLRSHGFSPKFVYAPNLDTALLMVESGLGVTFSYEKSIGSYNPAMKFLPVKPGQTMTGLPELVFAWNKDLQNDSARLFLRNFS